MASHGRTSRRLLPAQELAGWRSGGTRRSGTTGLAYIGLDLGTSQPQGRGPPASATSSLRARETRHRAAGRRPREQTPRTGSRRREQCSRGSPPSVPPWRGIGLSGNDPDARHPRRGRGGHRPGHHMGGQPRPQRGGGDRRGGGRRRDVRAHGQPLDGRYLLPMAAWLTRHDPDRMARTSVILGAKDYLFLQAHRPLPHRPQHGDRLRLLRSRPTASAATGRPGRRGLPPVSADTRPLLPEIAERVRMAGGQGQRRRRRPLALGRRPAGHRGVRCAQAPSSSCAASTLTLTRSVAAMAAGRDGLGRGDGPRQHRRRRRMALPPAGLRRHGSGRGRPAAAAARDDTVPLALPFVVAASRVRSGTPTYAARSSDWTSRMVRPMSRDPRRHHPGGAAVCAAGQGEVRVAWAVRHLVCQRLAMRPPCGRGRHRRCLVGGGRVPPRWDRTGTARPGPGGATRLTPPGDSSGTAGAGTTTCSAACSRSTASGRRAAASGERPRACRSLALPLSSRGRWGPCTPGWCCRRPPPRAGR